MSNATALEAPISSPKVFIPSEHQQRIFDFAESGTGSAIVIAVAGAGKTTTMMEMLKRLPSHLRILVLAFNKGIAEEFKKRIPDNAKGATMHSVGYAAWCKFIGKRLNPDENKVRSIMRDLLSSRDLAIYGSFVAKMVSLAKSVGMTCLVPDVESEWVKLATHYDISPDTEGASVEKGVELARMILKQSINEARSVIDYDDMLFMPLIENVAFPKYDIVCVDEAQDTNGVQRALLKRMLEQPNGRLIAVGDPKQAIYGFRGADSSAMEMIKKEFGCVELYLTVSYRCPQAVVKKAQEIVPYIIAHESAPVGSVEVNPARPFRSSDSIICRNSAQLVSLAYALIGKRIGCQILGRDIGKGLVDLINKMNAKGVDALLEKLAEYERREVDKFMAKDQTAQAESLRDKVTCITICIDSLSETSRTVPALIASIDGLFTDKDKGVLTLCTVHKSKGLEWERVYILDADKLMPSKWARLDWQKEQETNLMYVAYTRAKLDLAFIDSEIVIEAIKTMTVETVTVTKEEEKKAEASSARVSGEVRIGDKVEVIKGRTAPIGTKGMVVQAYGEPWFAIIIKDDKGRTHKSYAKNVKVTAEK
jgi:DNA helicase-2/ATP-dependent DNA helicase PcrA